MENDNFTTIPNLQYNDNKAGSLTSFDNTDTVASSSVAILSHKNSEVWNHFTKDINFKINKKAYCNYCPTVYTCSGSSTSNLTKYLNKYYSSKLNLPVKETNIENYFNSTQVNIKQYNDNIVLKFAIYLQQFYI
jgi:BED zinc finger